MQRIGSLDCLKGLAMVLMALDHTRIYLHAEAYLYHPMDLEQTSLGLFLTRFITHICAPVFILLAGTSSYLVGKKLPDTKSLSLWLVKRGVSLIFLEFTLVHFAWYFEVKTDYLLLGILWAIGASMLILAAAIYLPRKVLFIGSLLIITGHNLLDGFDTVDMNVFGFTWYILHLTDEVFIGGFGLFNTYPLIPTVAILALGYCIGPMMQWPPQDRIRALGIAGISMLLAFIVLRGFTEYGDYWPWEEYDTYTQSWLSFIDVHKSPASLLYVLVTLGVAALFVTWIELKKPARIAQILSVYGRVPMFYYIVHIFVIHAIAMLLAGWEPGYLMRDMIINEWMDADPALEGFGYSLPVVYGVTIAVVAALYPVCQWYHTLKRNHPNNAVLRYI